MEKHYLRQFQDRRGRFRSFLLGALKHFIANERDRAQAQKRGGTRTPVPLDEVLRTGESRYSLEPHSLLTPETIYERQWALAVLARVQEQVEREAAAEGRGRQFERLSRA
jgi:RNA polymerase sigma-70 factor (ECF subfamily)